MTYCTCSFSVWQQSVCKTPLPLNPSCSYDRQWWGASTGLSHWPQSACYFFGFKCPLRGFILYKAAQDPFWNEHNRKLLSIYVFAHTVAPSCFGNGNGSKRVDELTPGQQEVALCENLYNRNDFGKSQHKQWKNKTQHTQPPRKSINGSGKWT